MDINQNEMSLQNNSTTRLPDPVNTRTGEHFTTIQAAIDSNNTINGDTIILEEGTYHENVVVNKTLKLTGQGMVLVTPANPDKPVLTITETGSGSNIQGFIIQGGGETGIVLDHGVNCKISGNIISNFDCGIAAIAAETIFEDNQIKNNNTGIYILSSEDNTVSSNIISNNTLGILIEKSRDNTLSGNCLIDNTTPLFITSLTEFTLTDFNQDIDSSNTVNGKPVYYLVSENGLVIDGNDPKYSAGIGYLALVFCENIKVENISISNNYEGILLVGSHDISIENNQLSNNNTGIFLLNSTHNYIRNNQVNNNDFGLYLDNSNSNRIFENNINHNYTWGISIIHACSYNLLFGNQINYNGNGLILNASIENALGNNSISNNTRYGIRLYYSPNNHFQENSFRGNYFNIDLTGNFSSYIQEQFDSSNKVNGKPVYYFVGENGLVIDGNDPIYSAGIGYLALVLCNDVTVKNIDITNNGQGILLAGATNILVEKSKFTNNENGISSQYSSHSIIKNNNLTKNDVGIYAYYSDIKINNNQITENATGLYSYNSTGDAQFNRITGNTIAIVNESSASVNAALNWWGSNKPDFNQLVKGNVNITPWMVLSITADPPMVNVGGTSIITADLLHDNQGTYHNPADGVIPYTGSADFKTSQGNINDANFSNGKAQSALTDLITPGTAKVSSTVDDQTVTTDVTVSDGITITQLVNAASTVKKYYELHQSLPNNVIIGGQTITMPQFLQLLCIGTININKGITTPLPVHQVNPAPNPSGTFTSGKFYKTEYLKVAQNIVNFINTNGKAPNYQQTTLGKIPFSKLVYIYSKIINYYGTGNRLPNYVNIT